jgi:hypothetical protein
LAQRVSTEKSSKGKTSAREKHIVNRRSFSPQQTA